MTQDPAYYAIIPANVRYDKTLPPAAKLLYGEITALCKAKGYCWAANKYFADLYEVSEDSVSLWISKLKKSGYVRPEYGKETGYERRLYLSEKIQTPPLKNSEPLLKKFSGLSEKIQEALLKISEHNNILNTILSNTEKEEEDAEGAGANADVNSTSPTGQTLPPTPPVAAAPSSPKKVYGDNELKKIVGQYFRDHPKEFPEIIYPDFLDYWTEIVQNSERASDIGKERWRTQNTWNLAKRLATWHTNFTKDQQKALQNAATRSNQPNGVNAGSRPKNGTGRPIKRTPTITPDKLRRDGQANGNARSDGDGRTIVIDVDGGS